MQNNNGEIKTYLVSHGDKSEYFQNSMINMLKFFMNQVYNKNLPNEIITRPKKGFYLPDILSEQEVADTIDASNNLKHKLLLSLIYGGGLRRSEVQNLRPSDIDIYKNLIFIKGGKGRKDRYTLFSDQVHQILKTYIKKYAPKKYLFEGWNGNEKYSFTSMAKVLKSAAKSAGIQRRVNLHMLRHSFATHMLDNGFDIMHIMQLLGHSSIKTTQRYLHLTNYALRKIKSPLDNLAINKNCSSFNPDEPP